MAEKTLKREIITTDDGSTTLFIPDLDEHYHSVNGAIQESMHVFIRTGLHSLFSQNEIRIFEVGFGTGLNAFLTLNSSAHSNVFYHSIEKYPLSQQEVEALNYPEQLSASYDAKTIFKALHSCEWNKSIELSENFILRKEQVDLNDFTGSQDYNLIYFDAFAPTIQADLWTVEIFQKMYDLLTDDGVLVTYSAKGQVRRNMQQVGFKVERLPGPPGKREMLRAIKSVRL